MTSSAFSEAIEASREPEPPTERRKTIPERLLELDDTLASGPNPFPRISDWWKARIFAFYGGTFRRGYFRVGRRGGKSSTWCRVAVCEALYGDHAIQPGDKGIVPIVSENVQQAKDRIDTIGKILSRLGVRFKQTAQQIVLEDQPIEFRAYACTVGAVSGFTAIFVLLDEVAKWKNTDTGANPADEVISAIAPTMSTMPNARMVLISSPLGTLDAHARGFDEGTTADQMTAFAETWVAYPGIGGSTTVEQAIAYTHRDEPNENKWKREYAAIPMEGSEESLFTTKVLDRCTRDQAGDLPPEPGVEYIAAMDPAFVKNAWTLCIAGQRYVTSLGADGRTVARFKRAIVVCREWRGSQDTPLNPEVVLKEIAALCRMYSLEFVWSDQYEQFSLHNIGARKDVGIGLALVEAGSVAKLARYEELVTMMFDGEVDIPPDRQLRADLLAVRQKLTPNGFTIQLPETPDGRHADYAPSASIALCKALVEPKITPEQRRAMTAPEIKPGFGTVEAYAAEQAELTERLEREAAADKQEFWEKLLPGEPSDWTRL